MIEVKPTSVEDTTVAVLYGGKSNEREVSINSAKAVEKALINCGFDVCMIDTAQSRYIDTLEQLGADVVFNCLHGRGGEDGCVQGVCMELGLKFTGSGVLASALAMDKARAKIMYEAAQLNTAASLVVYAGQAPKCELAVHETYEEVAQKLGNKFVAKPAHEGSAVGVAIVDNQSDFDKAIKEAFELDDAVLLETYIAGTEITVAVLGNDELMCLPIVEIVPCNDFYNYESKYSQGGAKHICPANLDSVVTQKCQDAATKAHKALGCRGVSRSDFIITASGEPYILETNTIPGMTETSLLPDAAKAAGINFEDLCKLLVDLALE